MSKSCIIIRIRSIQHSDIYKWFVRNCNMFE
jgi:hypothetical protein